MALAPRSGCTGLQFQVPQTKHGGADPKRPRAGGGSSAPRDRMARPNATTPGGQNQGTCFAVQAAFWAHCSTSFFASCQRLSPTLGPRRGFSITGAQRETPLGWPRRSRCFVCLWQLFVALAPSPMLGRKCVMQPNCATPPLPVDSPHTDYLHIFCSIFFCLDAQNRGFL